MSSSKDRNIAQFEAILLPDGSYINKYNHTTWYNAAGEIHKEDGPAIIYADRSFSWWLNSNAYTFNRWFKLTPISDEQKLLLRLQYE
jgi:hypothetical protein